MADVFISYKSERKKAAQHLSRILELNGYSVWFDYGLLSGRDFGPQIEREIRAAKAVIVLWCSRSRDSKWVLEEAHLAESLDTLTPVWLERVDLPFGFARTDTIDLSVWDGAARSHGLDRLLNEVARRVGREPVPSFRGLQEYEDTWRRFGALPLSQFALAAPLAEREEPRGLGAPPIAHPAGDIPINSDSPKTEDDVQEQRPWPYRLILIAATTAIVLVIVIIFVALTNGPRKTVARPNPTASLPALSEPEQARLRAITGPQTFHASFSSANETPPVAPTIGTGRATIQLDPLTKMITYEIEFSGLTGPSTAVYLDCSDRIAIPFRKTDSPINGSAALTDSQLLDLYDGKCYINIHTRANESGEISGSLIRVPPPNKPEAKRQR